jgi:hypothetical protein
MRKRYQAKHEGTAIICGSAPCVSEDLEKALTIRPYATLLGVNNVGAMIDGIEHVWTQHNNLAQNYKENAKVKVHARENVMGDFVDFVWPSLNWVCGSSGVAGALWAKHGMDFDEVIMAGIPLSLGNLAYSEKYPSKYTKEEGFATDNQIDHWLSHLRTFHFQGKTAGIFSMSGSTSRILGMPSA